MINYKFKTKPYAHQLKALEKSWDKQEKMYYSTEFNIYERGEINEQDKL